MLSQPVVDRTGNAREQLLAGLPVAERRLKLAGVSTTLLRGGEGPPMVLLHGPGEFAGGWLTVLPQLVRTHDVIVPDLPGHGDSQVIDGALDADRVLRWLGELIEQTCSMPPVLVGRVIGGTIGARFAMDRGDRLSQLVLVDTLGLTPFEPDPRFGLAMHRFFGTPTADSYDRFMDFCAYDLDGVRARLGERWTAFEAYAVELAATPAVQTAVGNLIGLFAGTPMPPTELARIDVPTTLIWGRQDLVTPLHVAESASGRYGWPLHVIDDAGDDPALERPEAFLDTLMSALTVANAGGPGPMTTTGIAALAGGRVDVTAEQLSELEARLDGQLLSPGEEGWADATLVWNAMAARTPALVIRPSSAGDIAVAVRFAREHGILISVKGGGHNIAGTSMAEGGLTLDMSDLRDVTVDAEARLVSVGPGCLLRDVDRATQERGLATVLGFISEVGVAGLTLGGGFGYLMRRFGWAVDNLDEVEIVTADGEVRVASREQHADLFWALRGGGGNFGVVTRFVFRLHEVGPLVTGGLIGWDAARADEVLVAYRDLTSSAPRELTCAVVMRIAPPAPFIPKPWHGRHMIAMLVCHSGPNAESDLAPLRALGEPLFDLIAEQPYVDQQSMMDGLEPKGQHYYWKTEFLPALPDDFLAAFRDGALAVPSVCSESVIFHVGGAANEKAGDDGAVGNRDVHYITGFAGAWAADGSADEHIAWVRKAWESISPYSTGGNYVNFQLADDDNTRTAASYGSNLERLRQVKAAYDPDNLFRVNRNITPA